jgi:hypothetical protein
MNTQVNGCIGWMSIGIFIVIVGAIFAFFRYIISNKKNISVQKKLLFIPPVFICGFILYLIGYYEVGTKEQLVTLVSRSFISATRMFFSFSDVSGIRMSLRESQYFMLIFSIVNLFALLVSFVVVLQLLGNKVYYWFKYYLSHPKKCYIFFDISDASIALAKNILKKNKEAFVIFIRKRIYAIDDDKCESYFEYQEELLRIGEIRKTNAIIIEREYSDTSSLSEIGVKRLFKHAEKCELFFLSDEENDNIRLALSIIKHKQEDISLGKTKIVSHILYSSEQNEKSFFKYASKHHNKNNRISFINQSQLSALRLINVHPPVEYIKIDDSKAIALEDFNVMILGFGEIGQYSLRYLIEQGQFVGSTFHASVIDENMDGILGLFNERYPAIKDNYSIDYRGLRKNSAEYFDYIYSHISNMKYIVVAYGNDKVNIDTAIELKDILIKRGLDIPIFVNIKKDDNMLMTSVFGKINEDKETGSINICSTNDKGETNCTINIFGMNKNIFSYENIIDDNTIQKAMQVNKIYGRENWENLNAMKKISNISVALHLQTKLKLLCITKEEVKDYHDKKTFIKSIDNEKRTNLAITEHLRWNATYFVYGWQKGADRDDEKEYHICLVPWDELPNVGEQYQGYDFDNVDGIYDLCTK